MGMKVCKLVRLTSKDSEGLYVNGKEGKVTLRNRVVVSEDSVKEYEDNYGTSGLLYIVDEKATAKRDAEVEAEVKAARGIEEEKAPDTL
jgi:hypothetical protein